MVSLNTWTTWPYVAQPLLKPTCLNHFRSNFDRIKHSRTWINIFIANQIHTRTLFLFSREPVTDTRFSETCFVVVLRFWNAAWCRLHSNHVATWISHEKNSLHNAPWQSALKLRRNECGNSDSDDRHLRNRIRSFTPQKSYDFYLIRFNFLYERCTLGRRTDELRMKDEAYNEKRDNNEIKMQAH